VTRTPFTGRTERSALPPLSQATYQSVKNLLQSNSRTFPASRLKVFFFRTSKKAEILCFGADGASVRKRKGASACSGCSLSTCLKLRFTQSQQLCFSPTIFESCFLFRARRVVVFVSFLFLTSLEKRLLLHQLCCSIFEPLQQRNQRITRFTATHKATTSGTLAQISKHAASSDASPFLLPFLFLCLFV